MVEYLSIMHKALGSIPSHKNRELKQNKKTKLTIYMWDLATESGPLKEQQVFFINDLSVQSLQGLLSIKIPSSVRKTLLNTIWKPFW